MSFYLFIAISFYLFISILCAKILCVNEALKRINNNTSTSYQSWVLFIVSSTNLDVRYHSKKSSFSLVVTVALTPGRSQSLFLHQEEIPGSCVHLVQRTRIDRFLVRENKSRWSPRTTKLETNRDDQLRTRDGIFS